MVSSNWFKLKSIFSRAITQDVLRPIDDWVPWAVDERLRSATVARLPFLQHMQAVLDQGWEETDA